MKDIKNITDLHPLISELCGYMDESDYEDLDIVIKTLLDILTDGEALAALEIHDQSVVEDAYDKLINFKL